MLGGVPAIPVTVFRACTHRLLVRTVKGLHSSSQMPAGGKRPRKDGVDRTITLDRIRDWVCLQAIEPTRIFQWQIPVATRNVIMR